MGVNQITTQFLYAQVSWGSGNWGISEGCNLGLEKFPEIHSALQPPQREAFLTIQDLLKQGEHFQNCIKPNFHQCPVRLSEWLLYFLLCISKTPGVDVLLEEEKAKVKTKPEKQLCIPGTPKDPVFFRRFLSVTKLGNSGPVVQPLTLRPWGRLTD